MKPVIGITADIDKEYLKIKRDYVRAVAEAGGLPIIIAPSDDACGVADKIDGLVLSGGGDILPNYYGENISVPLEVLKPVEKERIDFEIELFREAMKRQKPILAICYGMQLVNAALGGTLYQDISPLGTDLKSVPKFLNHRQGQHMIKIDNSFYSTFHIPQYANTQSINSSHHQAIKSLADGLEIFALSNDGIIEGFYKRDYPFLVCCQWHPERDLCKNEISPALFRLFIDAAKRQSMGNLR
ncbi:MAG: gamma-glutamyl-gamma-aminobutyrate hydrolase family protein [Deltaproteobacteria bacterium]|nr:gamma-glutamyl-gamma-aminobutyrate hydrolase family protein [Deltaproteobacteria bacterium]